MSAWSEFVERYGLRPSPGQKSFAWREDDHPREPQGAPEGHGGEFTAKQTAGDGHDAAAIVRAAREAGKNIWAAAREAGANPSDPEFRRAMMAAAEAHPAPPESQAAVVRSQPPSEPRAAAMKKQQAVRDYAENGTRSAAFKAWFGDWEHDAANASKVVDPETGEPQPTKPIDGAAASRVVRDGRPVVVFHGTALAGGFDSFDPKKIKKPDDLLYGQGFYFTEMQEVAEEYAGAQEWTVANMLDSREAAEALKAEREKEWREAFGDKMRRGMEDVRLAVKQQGDSWSVVGRGYHPIPPSRLSGSMAGEPAKAALSVAMRALGEFRASGDDDNVEFYEKIAAQANRAAKGDQGSADLLAEFIVDPGNQLAMPKPKDQEIADAMLAASGLSRASAQREVKAVYLNIRNPFDPENDRVSEDQLRGMANADSPQAVKLRDKLASAARQSKMMREHYREKQIEHGEAAARFRLQAQSHLAKLEKRVPGASRLLSHPDRLRDGLAKGDPEAVAIWEAIPEGDNDYGLWANSMQDADRQQKLSNKAAELIDEHRDGLSYTELSGIFGSKGPTNEFLRSLGYDGMTHTGGIATGSDRRHRVWIAFEPNQIKAVDNVGTFDPEDNRLRYAMGELDREPAAPAQPRPPARPEAPEPPKPPAQPSVRVGRVDRHGWPGVGENPATAKMHKASDVYRAEYPDDDESAPTEYKGRRKWKPAGYPLGSWRYDDRWKGIHGRSIEQLVEFDPNDLDLPEGDYSKVNQWGQYDNHEGRGDDARQYADWWAEGSEPPPINVTQMRGGAWKVSDGHRRASAAKMLGRPVKAWVSYTEDGPSHDYEGRPIETGLTDEIAKRRYGGERPATRFGDVLQPEQASAEVSRLRAGDSRSKNQGRAGAETIRYPLVHSSLPTSYFDARKDPDHGTYVDFLKSSTDPQRVADYAGQTIDAPIYVAQGRSGDYHISDGGHRFLAAKQRGDRHVPALIPQSLHDAIHGAKQSPQSGPGRYDRRAGELAPDRQTEKGGGRWVTLGGGAPAKIDEDGTILEGCPGLKGHDVEELDETREFRDAKQTAADQLGIEGEHLEEPGAWAALHQEATDGDHPDDVGADEIPADYWEDHEASQHAEADAWSALWQDEDAPLLDEVEDEPPQPDEEDFDDWEQSGAWDAWQRGEPNYRQTTAGTWWLIDQIQSGAISVEGAADDGPIRIAAGQDGRRHLVSGLAALQAARREIVDYRGAMHGDRSSDRPISQAKFMARHTIPVEVDDEIPEKGWNKGAAPPKQPAGDHDGWGIGGRFDSDQSDIAGSSDQFDADYDPRVAAREGLQAVQEPTARHLLELLQKTSDFRRGGNVTATDFDPDYARRAYEAIKATGDVHDLGKHLGPGAIGYLSPAGVLAIVPPSKKGGDWEVRYSAEASEEGWERQRNLAAGGRPFRMSAPLRSAVRDAVGDDPNDQELLLDAIADVWPTLRDRAKMRNEMHRDILGIGQARGAAIAKEQGAKAGARAEAAARAAFTRQIRNASDPAAIPGFDEILQIARAHHSDFFTSVDRSTGASDESSLFEALKLGIQPVPQPYDPGVIESALGYMARFRRPAEQYRRPARWWRERYRRWVESMDGAFRAGRRNRTLEAAGR